MTDLFPADALPPPSIEAQIKAVDEIRAMEAVLETLQGVREGRS